MKQVSNRLDRLRLAAGAFAWALVAMPVAAQAPSLAALDGLKKGAWSFRDRVSGASRTICVRSGQEFIQLRHSQPGCSRTVVQDGPREVAVQYTCRGNGYGRTSIRREDASLVQIRSQGIFNGAPFTIQGEARYTGSC